MNLGNYEESLKYWHRLESVCSECPIWKHAQQRIAIVYWKLGYKETADEYLDEMVDFSNKRIESGEANYADYYNLAGVLAFRGNKEMALENLKICQKSIPVMFIQDLHRQSNFIRKDAMFDHIRDEPEFQQVVSELDARHEEVQNDLRQWLEEHDLI